MSRYGFDFYINDLLSSPLMKMARLYDSTVSNMTAGAGKMARQFQPVADSVERLNGRLNQLREQRNLSIDTGEIERADREMVRLERRIERLQTPGRPAVASPLRTFSMGSAAQPLAPLTSAVQSVEPAGAPDRPARPKASMLDTFRYAGNAFGGASREATKLQQQIDKLTEGRALMVDATDVGRATRQIAQLEQRLERVQAVAARPTSTVFNVAMRGADQLTNLFPSATQRVERLQSKLNALTERRALMVDFEQAARADRQIQNLERDLAKAQARAARPAGSGFFGSMVQGAQRLSGALFPARQSVDALNQKLNDLRTRRDLMVGTGEITRANREIEQLERRVERMQSRGRRNPSGSADGGGFLGTIGRTALPYMGAAALATGAVGFAKSGMDREQTKVAFEQFVGKQGVAPLMGTLNTFADKTPYSNEDVYGAGQRLLAAKVAPNQLQNKLTNIGNMAAVTKGSFADMTDAYGSAKQRDVVGNDLLSNQFSKTGVSDQLQKNLGVNGDQLFKMAEKRQIKFADLDKAIADLSAKGGLYEGGLDKLSATAGGKWSTFLGTLQNKFATWAEGLNPMLSSAFDFGTGLLSQIDPLIAKLQPIFSVIATGMVQVWTATEPVRALLGTLWGTVTTLIGNFGGLSGAGTGLQTMFGILSAVIWTISTGLQWVGNLALWLVSSPFVQLIGIVYGAVRAAMFLNAVLLANPVGFVVGAILATVAAIKYLWDNVDGFRGTLMKLWEVAKQVFGRIGAIAKAAFTFDFTGLAKELGAAWNEGTATGQKRSDHYKAVKNIKEGFGKPAPVAGPGSVFAPKPGAMPGAGAGGGKAGKGVESGVTGAKSTNITINLKSLVEGGVHVHSATVSDGLQDIERRVKEIMLTVLNSANNLESA